MFVAKTAAFLEELKVDGETDIDEATCLICNKPEASHATFAPCPVCYEMSTVEQMFTLKCGHSYCLPCTRSHLEKLITECEVSKLKCLDYECRETF